MTEHVVSGDALGVLGIGQDKVVREELGDGRVKRDAGVLGVVLDEQGDGRWRSGSWRTTQCRRGSRAVQAVSEATDVTPYALDAVALPWRMGNGQTRHAELAHEIRDLGVEHGGFEVLHLEGVSVLAAFDNGGLRRNRYHVNIQSGRGKGSGIMLICSWGGEKGRDYTGCGSTMR